MSIKNRLERTSMLETQNTKLMKTNNEISIERNELKKALGEILKEIAHDRPDLVFKYMVFYDNENSEK